MPMLGRIYASENFPKILYDQKAMDLKPQLPKELKGQDTQTQYTLMASAVRSTNTDRYIRDFMAREPEGIVVQLGCGLETTFYRNDNGHTQWYEVDLPSVIAYRKELIGETERDHCIAADAFGETWMETVRGLHPTAPMLVTASGLFYYFTAEKVLDLFRTIRKYGPAEAVFDAVNSSGMKQMSKYMKQVGHEDASMYFYVNSGETLAQDVGGKLLKEESYYAHTDKKGLQFMTATPHEGLRQVHDGEDAPSAAEQVVEKTVREVPGGLFYVN